jgi:hypothetical protein
MADISLDGGDYWGSAADNLPKGGAPNVPAPGNPTNEISGFYDRFLGPGRAQSGAADVQNWANSGLDLGTIQNRIANSPEAMAYAKANQPSPSGYSGTSIFSDPATSAV